MVADKFSYLKFVITLVERVLASFTVAATIFALKLSHAYFIAKLQKDLYRTFPN